MSVHTDAREERIYNHYRQALRKLKQQSDGFRRDPRDRPANMPADYAYRPRAAERRNMARKMTVDRYNVSFADVKRIVATFDAATGVTHEHDVRYQREENLRQARAAFAANPAPCQNPNCEYGDDVEVNYDPFEAEIHENYELVTLCKACYMVLEEDI